MAKLTNTKTEPKKKKAPARKTKSKSKNHIYILIIMALCAVIIVMLNYNLAEKGAEKKPQKDPAKSSAETVKKEQPKIEKKGEENSPDEKEPVKAEPEKRDAKIYFLKMDEKSEKVLLVPVVRKINSSEPVKNAFVELLKGPSPSEKKKALLSAIPENLRIKNITVKNRIAEIDFNNAIESGGGANILLSRLDQIIYTATQFDDIDGVVIKINGKPKKTLGGEGVSISGVLKRRQN